MAVTIDAKTEAPNAPGTYREVEIKLDAEANFVLPDLTTLPGVLRVSHAEPQQLEAVYLDSADLRLITHGSTLRRRTGGSDAGWHLKLPADKNGRIEVRRSLGSSVHDVPADLLGLVRLQLRGLPVGPVARISTRRTVRLLLGADDVVLPEVADDHVTAEAMGETLTTSSWREIEVELVEADGDLLDRASSVLVKAGARPAETASKLQRALARRLTPAEPETSHRPAGKSGKGAAKKAKKPAVPTAGQVAVEYLAVNVAALITEDPRVRISADDAVHQMRVATRRLRTGLATFRPMFAEGTVQGLREELKWIGGLLGVARDAEVMKATLIRDLAAQPAELVLGPVQRRVERELDQAYQEGHAVVLEALDGDRFLELVGALEAFVASPPFGPRGAQPAPEELRKRVRTACRRVQQAAVELDAVRDRAELDLHLHEVRIAAKRARYAAEAARPVTGRPAKTLASAMAQIQETLGNHQDAVVERQWLRELGIRAFLAGENGFTFGRLHGLTESRAEHDEERFDQIWASARSVMAAWPA